MSAIKLATPSSGSISLSPANTASNLTITVPAVSATMATLTTPSFVSTIGVGGATPAASGAGITFPVTQSASSDANTLDDYEEGTWTPTITSGTGSITSYSASGSYIKIGRQVTIAVIVNLNNVGTAGGRMRYTLPFTQISTPYFTGSVREYAFTGTWYFTEIDGGGGDIWNSTNGAIAWTNGYTYTWSITYFVS